MAGSQLRSQRERVEDLVDDVVQAYHNGFNKAIHNYSRILHLFSESKEQVLRTVYRFAWLTPCPVCQARCRLFLHVRQHKLLAVHSFYTFQVEKLRICLEEARRRLGAQSRSLQQQWRRGITLGDTARLLGDVNSISDAPQRVQKLEEAKVRHCYTMFEALQLAHSVQCFVQQRANWQAGTCSCLLCLPTLCPFVFFTDRM